MRRDDSREEKKKKRRSDHDHYDHYDDDDCDECDKALGQVFGGLILWGVTSPWWIPAAALGDDYGRTAYFPRFPYDDVPGYLAIYSVPENARRCG